MSEMKAESREFDEKLNKELEKQDSKKKEQILAKKLMEDTKKKVEKVTEEYKAGTSQSIKTTSKSSISNKPKDPKATETCQIFKTMIESSISNKPDNPEAIEECQMPKNTSTSTQLETSKVCQKPKTTSKISTTSKTDRKVTEICEMPKITSETCTRNIPKYRKVPEICQMFKTASKESTKLEASEIPGAAKVCQMPKTASEGSIEFETPEIPKATNVCQVPKTASEGFIVLKAPEIPDPPKMYQMLKTTSEGSIELEAPKIPEAVKVYQTPKTTFEEFTKLRIFEIPETANVYQTPKTTTEASTYPESETLENPNVAETFQMLKSPQEVQTTSEPSTSNKTKEAEMPKGCSACDSEITEICENADSCLRCSSVLAIPISSSDMEKMLERSTPQSMTTDDESTTTTSILEADDYKLSSSTYAKDSKDNLKDSTKQKKSLLKEDSTKSANDTGKTVMIPVIEKVESARDMIKARKFWPPMSLPDFNEHPLVLATHHLVPSLPIGLFEMFAEMIEIVTKKPVVLLHECRDNRPVATEVADIVILPAGETWKDGVLLPASFVFEHRLNKDKSANMYADVIVAKDRAPHIQDVMDLRGHRCAIPNKRHQFTAAGLLFSYLHSKGENVIFFGNILDASTQLEVLEMVASKQAEVGILESSAIRCNKYNVPGVDSLHILTSLGPLPPYRIMIKNTLTDELAEKLTAYLLNIDKHEEWLERLSPYGVVGFAKNSMDYYNLVDKKCVDTNVPYY